MEKHRGGGSPGNTVCSGLRGLSVPETPSENIWGYSQLQRERFVKEGQSPFIQRKPRLPSLQSHKRALCCWPVACARLAALHIQGKSPQRKGENPAGRASGMARRERVRLPIQEARVRSPGWDDPPEEEITTRSSVPAWETPWTEAPGGLQSLGSQSQTRLGAFIAHSAVIRHTDVCTSWTRNRISSGETAPNRRRRGRHCRTWLFITA